MEEEKEIMTRKREISNKKVKEIIIEKENMIFKF